jgi:hypothetical protein
MRKLIKSEVPNHEGWCKPVWLNRNSVNLRIDGRVTGFFRLVRKHRLFGWIKTGEQFHGYVTSKGVVKTTEGIYSASQFE